jgi:hypothetical protein
VDRDVQVRAVRRRQALDALAFERDREGLLVEQLEETVAEIDGARVDTELYAQLSPEDSLLVRRALGHDTVVAAEDDEQEGFDLSVSFEDDEVPPDPEDEVARLQAELALSRRRQAALERYLELLSDQLDSS